jgi:hypothetical protein
MMLDPVSGERILPVIKVGVLLREEDSVLVISHGVVPPEFVQIELGLCYRATIVGWDQQGWHLFATDQSYQVNFPS